MLQFVRRQPRRDRDHERAYRERRIKQFDDLDAVGKKHDDPIARTDALRPETTRDAPDSTVEIPVGKPFVAADQGNLVRVTHGLRAKYGFQAHIECLRRR